MQYNDSEAGIYIHIPFCHRACHYCNFHFSTSTQLKPAYIGALCKELHTRSAYLGNKQIRSIYFGGGTPSMLSSDELQRIMDVIGTTYDVLPDAEITLEANPDDIKTNYIRSLQHLGINRLSIGIQSFFDKDLVWMNRTHTGAEAKACIDIAQQAGIDNISADLIYGIPGLTDDAWVENIRTLTGMHVPHISCYALTVEPKTALSHFIAKGDYAPVDDVQSAQQFDILRSMLAEEGYIHYEISNFAKEGRMAVHNTAYWLGQHYLGAGASAHSFNGASRQWNINNNALYIQLVNNDGDYAEKEELDTNTQMNERIMTSLRTMWGLDLKRFERDYGAVRSQALATEYAPLVAMKQLFVHDDHLFITSEYQFVADSVIAQLFFVD